MATYSEISSLEQWNDAFAASVERPLVVFKHSTTCPVSSNALSEFDQYLRNNEASNVDFVLVKVIESRPVSNRIAEDIGLKHESPQIMLVKNKEKVWSASHWSITNEHITAVLD